MAGMAGMSRMSKKYICITRHATVHPMSEMSEIFKMIARHVIMCSLESSAV
jgi:hypothetical protein